MQNQEIRNMLKESGVRQWQIADKLNISEFTLSRMLRYELPEQEKQRILSAMDEIKADRHVSI